MAKNERDTLIEWLYLNTGTHRLFWKRYDDKRLLDVSIINVIKGV